MGRKNPGTKEFKQKVMDAKNARVKNSAKRLSTIKIGSKQSFG